jgi:hypothetical protein
VQLRAPTLAFPVNVALCVASQNRGLVSGREYRYAYRYAKMHTDTARQLISAPQPQLRMGECPCLMLLASLVR